MKPQRAFFVAGIAIPFLLHVVASDKMPWWPDTVSLGLAFGFTAAVIAWKAPKDREISRRVWNTVKELHRQRQEQPRKSVSKTI